MLYVVAGVAVLGVLVSADVHARRGSHEGEHHESSRHGHSVHGVVTELPEGRLGTWIIGDRKVSVGRDTRINEEHGPLKRGSVVEVKGLERDGVVQAYEIEVKSGR